MGWDQKFMGLARHISTWSKDPSTKVGAVIVDDRRCVRSHGYNGFPRGIADTAERLYDRDWKLAHTVHAERNAILNAPVPVLGCVLYITAAPCGDCVLEIIQGGIREVVIPVASQDPFAERADWAEKLQAGLSDLVEVGIPVRHYEFRE